MAYSKNSFLANAPTMSFYTGLNFNNLPVIVPSISDTTVTLTEKYHMRPDLLANDLYDNVEFWWVFSLRNLEILKDPINDFKAGLVITAPSPATIESLSRG
tara:strand:- start:30684 stop:30986 length:303 start_codon:yes stop_codon:yes gene_type:complete